MYTPGDVLWYMAEREREAVQLAENWRRFQALKGAEVSPNPERSRRWLVFLRDLFGGPTPKVSSQPTVIGTMLDELQTQRSRSDGPNELNHLSTTLQVKSGQRSVTQE